MEVPRNTRWRPRMNRPKCVYCERTAAQVLYIHDFIGSAHLSACVECYDEILRYGQRYGKSFIGLEQDQQGLKCPICLKRVQKVDFN